MAPRRVIYVSPNAKFGGAEGVLQLLSIHHRRERYEPVVYFLTDGPLVAQFRDRGVECVVYPGPRPRLRATLGDPLGALRCARHLAATIRERRIALVHSVMSYGHLFGGVAARLAGVPETWFQHGPTGTLDWAAARVPTALLFVNSRFTARDEARYRPWAGETRLVYPGVETEEITRHASAGADFRGRHGIADGEIAVGLVGRMAPMKGHLTFLEAVARSRTEAVRTRYLMIGGPFQPQDAEYERTVRARAKELGLGDAVVFTGFVPYPQYASLAACDVIVNASVIPEPFGLTIVEGMTLRKTVVAPERGGPAEIITPGKDGLLYTPDSVPALADALARATGSAELREQLGARAARTVRERFGVERMVEEVEAAYDSVLDARG